VRALHCCTAYMTQLGTNIIHCITMRWQQQEGVKEQPQSNHLDSGVEAEGSIS
jgi:hypothetical protein